MSSAPAVAAEAPPPKTGMKKKLIIIVAAAVLLLSVLGGGALFYMKRKAAAMEAASGEGGDSAQVVEAKAESDKHEHQPPVFVPLEPFTVNLADKDQDRYLQVGLTFELADEKASEQIKLYMPAIRNAVLMILSHKNSQDLLQVEGKEQMAEEIRVASARAMGIEVPDPGQAGSEGGSKKKRKRPENPIRHVNYSNFIIQ